MSTSVTSLTIAIALAVFSYVATYANGISLKRRKDQELLPPSRRLVAIPGGSRLRACRARRAERLGVDAGRRGAARRPSL